MKLLLNSARIAAVARWLLRGTSFSILATIHVVTGGELNSSWSINLARFADTAPAMDMGRRTIYLGTWEGLHAVSTNGTLTWKFPTHSEIRSSPAVDTNGTIYFGCRDQNLYAIRDGKKLWSFQTDSWVDSSPAIGRAGSIIFGSWDSNIYCLRSDGEQDWKFQTKAPVSASAVIGKDGVIFCGSHDGMFYSLSERGEPLWTYETGGAVISSPALDRDGSVIFSSASGWLYSFESSGKMKWKLHTGGITDSAPILAGDGSVLIGVNNAVWRISTNGVRLWEWRMPHPMRMSVAALKDNGVLVSVFQGPLRWLDSAGNELHTSPLWAGSDGAPSVDSRGHVYIAGSNGHFHLFAAGIPLEQSPWPKVRGNLRNTGNLADSDSF